MKSLAEYAKAFVVKKEDLRKDKPRRDLITRLTERLNTERERDNEMKVDKYRWENQVSKERAREILMKEKDPAKKIYSPYTERGVFFKTRHLDTDDLYFLFDKCNEAEKDGRSFGKCFNSLLSIKK